MTTKKVLVHLTETKQVILEIPVQHNINDLATRTMCYETLQGLDETNFPIKKNIDFSLSEIDDEPA